MIKSNVWKVSLVHVGINEGTFTVLAADLAQAYALAKDEYEDRRRQGMPGIDHEDLEVLSIVRLHDNVVVPSVVRERYVKEDPSAGVEEAWGLIANAHGGNWDEATDVWRQAAERWRDRFITNNESEPGRELGSMLRENEPEHGDVAGPTGVVTNDSETRS